MNVREIRIEDFDYPLPDERIALHPLARRDACKLLASRGEGSVSHHIFSDLPILLRPDTLIIANETKVIRARMEFVKDTGAVIEIFLLEPLHPHDYVTSFASTHECSWTCLMGNRKRWKEGPLAKIITPSGGTGIRLEATLCRELPGSGYEVKFSWDNPSFSFAEIIEAAGNIPIPPYLKRKSEESDTLDYQTVYSRTEGSVAAPTAGLHFTPELIDTLKRYGNEFATVTLHVGAGTFQPVKSEHIGDHPMHTEWISVSRHTLGRLIAALENGRDILAVGTTSVRTLESLPYIAMLAAEDAPLNVGQWMPYEEKYSHIDTIRLLKDLLERMRRKNLDEIEANTSIMIAPGYRWRVVNRLVTNFHQPKSTLLLLVSSFLGGGGRWRRVYEEALRSDYRFLSYGDACLFNRGPQPVELPPAKSMVIRRATILAYTDPEKLTGLSQGGLCDDSYYYIRALQALLRSVAEPGQAPEEIYIGEGAAPLRFFTALAASMPGASVRVTCGDGLQRRPVLPLIEALRGIGADIEFDDRPDSWHITIRGRRLRGGNIKIDSSFTSQFLSALMLASPLWQQPLRLEDLDAIPVSRPYRRMTEEMMAHPDLPVEPDWSAAAFFYEYALMMRRDLRFVRLVPPARSLQGDAVCADFYGELGIATRFHPDGSAEIKYDGEAFLPALEGGEIEYDFTDFPDMVPSVAVALCYRGIPFRLHGIGHLRFKECDRLNALRTLLVRLGYEVGVENDSLVFGGAFHPMEEFPVEIDPYGDHRIAMAFYPLELLGMVRIEDKGVVSKSFPDFYQQF